MITRYPQMTVGLSRILSMADDMITLCVDEEHIRFSLVCISGPLPESACRSSAERDNVDRQGFELRLAFCPIQKTDRFVGGLFYHGRRLSTSGCEPSHHCAQRRRLDRRVLCHSFIKARSSSHGYARYQGVPWQPTYNVWRYGWECPWACRQCLVISAPSFIA
jgi:hypothetical protein